MKLNLKARDWHNWISVILVLPMLLVGLTTVFIAHSKKLGLEEIEVTPFVSWLPGYGAQAMQEMAAEVRASLVAADGTQWLGTKGGLYRITDGRAVQEAELGRTEVRDLTESPFGLVVATRNGVWVRGAQGWHMALRGDAWDASLGSDGAVAVTLKDKGVLTSRDGMDWQADEPLRATLSGMPGQADANKPVTLQNLVMDLHTGKAFFGKGSEWIWIDLLGVVWIFLGFTGLYMWWRSQTKRRDAAIKRVNAATEAVHG